jgi:hypothetical protein
VAARLVELVETLLALAAVPVDMFMQLSQVPRLVDMLIRSEQVDRLELLV